MASLTAVATLLAGALELGLLLASLRALRPGRAAIAGRIGVRRLQIGVAVVMAGVLLAMGAFTGVIFALWRSEIFTRFAHAVLLLGLMMLAVLLAAAAAVSIGLKVGSPPLALLGLAGVIPLLALLAPVARFAEVFGPVGLAPPLVLGVILIGACYAALWAAVVVDPAN